MFMRNCWTLQGSLLFTVLLSTRVLTTVACGNYIELSSTQTGTLSSPGYPGQYFHNALCIWLLKSPKNYAVRLSIPSVSGQVDAISGDCLDYVEVRNGSSTETLEYKECNTSTPVTVESYSRWLWVKFRTDNTGTPTTGFQATYSVVSSPGNADDEAPVVDCRYLRYRCPNKECISSAYICDGSEDCGCSHSGCDEISCGGINWSSTKKLAVGLTSGTILFCIIFFGIGALDIALKKWAEKKYMREAALRKKLAMQKRAQAAVKNLFVAGSNLSLNSSWTSKGKGDKSPTTPTSLVPPSPSSLMPPSPAPSKAK